MNPHIFIFALVSFVVESKVVLIKNNQSSHCSSHCETHSDKIIDLK